MRSLKLKFLTLRNPEKSQSDFWDAKNSEGIFKRSKGISNRSQVSQVFIFALGVIILGLILFFGYKVVNELRTKGDETAVIRFKTKLVNDIKILKEGDVYIKSYIIPKRYREVCFVDKEHEFNLNAHNYSEFYYHWDAFSTDEPKVSNSIGGNVKEDVFLVGENKFDSIFIGNIDLGLTVDSGGCPLSDILKNGDCTGCPPLPEGCLPHTYAVYCFEIRRSKLNILLEGKGDTILIQKPE